MNMTQRLPRSRPYLSYFLLVTLCLAFALLVRLPGLSDATAVQRDAAPAAEVPDFAAMEDVQARKTAFFDYFQPIVNDLNQEILAIRDELERLRDKVEDGMPLSREERGFISLYSREYEVQPQRQFSENHLRTLLRRVDVIPTSLVLAQAANESAWGTSRFAVEGNNYFGQWCYSEGCGLVPRLRREDASHEVKAFDSPRESVRAYFMNLNTFPSYQELRQIRQDLRASDRAIDGISLSEGLHSYSERGEAYIEELQSMIQTNDLLQRDSV